MNRREFLKSAIIGAVATTVDYTVPDLEKILLETTHLSDNEFVTYVTFHINMWVSNPSHSCILTSIGDEE